jgi:hypothetical protein
VSPLRSSMRCFLIQVELSTLARDSAGLPHLPSWVARRVDLRAQLARPCESTARLFLCARGTPCACGLLDDPTKPDTGRWQLNKQAGAALANVAHVLGTKMSPPGFMLVPMWVNHLYRAASPLSLQVIHLFEFIDSLIAGSLSNEARYWVRRELVQVPC